MKSQLGQDKTLVIGEVSVHGVDVWLTFWAETRGHDQATSRYENGGQSVGIAGVFK